MSNAEGNGAKPLIIDLNGETIANKLKFEPNTYVYWSCPIVFRNEFYSYGSKENIRQIAKEKLF